MFSITDVLCNFRQDMCPLAGGHQQWSRIFPLNLFPPWKLSDTTLLMCDVLRKRKKSTSKSWHGGGGVKFRPRRRQPSHLAGSLSPGGRSVLQHPCNTRVDWFLSPTETISEILGDGGHITTPLSPDTPHSKWNVVDDSLHSQGWDTHTHTHSAVTHDTHPMPYHCNSKFLVFQTFSVRSTNVETPARRRSLLKGHQGWSNPAPYSFDLEPLCGVQTWVTLNRGQGHMGRVLPNYSCCFFHLVPHKTMITPLQIAYYTRPDLKNRLHKQHDNVKRPQNLYWGILYFSSWLHRATMAFSRNS